MLFTEKNIIHLIETSSTMDDVKKYPLNTVVYADMQNKARGKSDRVWKCKDGNLYFSFSIDSSKQNLNYFNLSFLSAYCMLEAIKFFDKKNNLIQVKWPNDILINNKKCVGILLENDFKTKMLVVGIGVNINYFPQLNTIFEATSLENEGIFANKKELLLKFLEIFDYYYMDWLENGFEKIHKKWLENAYNYKDEIKVKITEDKYIVGIFDDFDNDGTLSLKLDDKHIKITSGEIYK